MKRIAIEDIDAGKPLPYSLCRKDGQELVAAGVRITQDDLSALFDRLEGKVYRADDAADETDVVISVDSLSPGATLPADLFDVNQILLLKAGSKITPRFIQVIRARGIREVKIDAAAAAELQGELSGDSDTPAEPEAPPRAAVQSVTKATESLDAVIEQSELPAVRMPPRSGARKSLLNRAALQM